MRVLHVDSARGWRGGQQQALLTARGMAQRGHTVLLALQEGGALAARAQAERLDLAPLRFRGDLWPGAALALRSLARRFRPDVLLLHDPHALAAGLLAAGAPGAFGPGRVAVRRVDFPLRGPLSRAKYRRCDRVVAVSRAIAEKLGAQGLPAERVRVVYEGVPDRPAPGGAREALAGLGVPRDALVVGNVAALTDHKDHRTLLEAAADVVAAEPRAFFVIVGEGELRSSLEALAARLGLGACCLFAGFRDDVERLMAGFDVFCLSSHMEGLGTSLLDAMCFARPIVATAAGGIPEAVQDGVNGLLVPVRSPAPLAEALLALLRDGERRAGFGAAGRRLFEQRFTADRMVEETLRVLGDAVSDPGGV